MVLNNTCECMLTLRKNAYGLVYTHTHTLTYTHVHMHMYTCIQAQVHFYQKSKDRRGKGKTHTQVQRSDFHDSAKVKRLRQIGAEMV